MKLEWLWSQIEVEGLLSMTFKSCKMLWARLHDNLNEQLFCMC